MKLMDLLFREYASPFSFLDAVISSGRLTDWVECFLDSHKEKIQWEHWLHKVFDKDWTDYVKELNVNPTPVAMTKSEIETTISDSYDVINRFVPNAEQKEGE